MEERQPQWVEPDRALLRAIDGGAFKGEPWFKDRWLIATLAAICGAGFMYAARQPEMDFEHRMLLESRNRAVVAAAHEKAALAASHLAKQSAVAPEPAKVKAVTQTNTSNEADRLSSQHASSRNEDRDMDSRLAGSSPLSPQPTELEGEIPRLPALTGQAAPVSPTTTVVVPDPPAQPELDGLYLAGTCSADSVGALERIIRRLDGGLRPFQEVAGRNKSDDGVIVWVPDRNARAFLDALQGASGVEVSDQSQLSSGEVSRKLTEESRSVLEHLEAQRTELTARYFDDAPAVKDIDDQIDEVKKSIASLKSPGRGYAVAKLETD